ncbi:nucleotidyltransferase family protein [Rhodothermus marinus]|uniref:nucleotidyltransferase family protein n=1 Tax=Rhodothermus marinus TaxID=29549 RepID=UPI0012BA3C71|nr:nucleotidyltransferase domain-containing protein [Rhodothermus marinus]BBM69964.1 DNA polymerase subunit beta [Rhodothermus marinus]BBM72950.1 DNA polymerase subunit beta [Rhodothermus marinus]
MPTALELRGGGWRPYLSAAKRRVAEQHEILAGCEERDALIDRARSVAQALKARFGVRRVVLLGSLAHGAWFAPDSDVDLAVEGLHAADYWEAWRLAEEMIADRPVDLIELERVGSALRQAIERYGIEL